MPAVGNVNPGRPAGVPNTPRKRKTAPIAVGGHPSYIPAPTSAAPSGGGAAPVSSAVLGAAPPTSSGVSAAQAAYAKQQNLLQNYVIKQAQKALVPKELKLAPKTGMVVGLKKSPRAIGQDLKEAAAELRRTDPRSSLDRASTAQIDAANAQGKVVKLPQVKKLAAQSASFKSYKQSGQYQQAGAKPAGESGSYTPPQTLLGGPATKAGGLKKKGIATQKGYPGLFKRYPSDVQFGLMLASAPLGGEAGLAAKGAELGTRALEAGVAGSRTEAIAAGAAGAANVGEAAIKARPLAVRGYQALKSGEAAQGLASAATKLAPTTTARIGAAATKVGESVPGARFIAGQAAKRPLLTGAVTAGTLSHPASSGQNIAGAVTALGSLDTRDLAKAGGTAIHVVESTPRAIAYTARALTDPTVRAQTVQGLKSLGFQAIEFPVIAGYATATQGPSAAFNELVAPYGQDISRRWTPILNSNYSEYLKQVKQPGAGGVAYQIAELLPLIHGESVGAKAVISSGARAGEHAGLPAAGAITNFLKAARPNLRRGMGDYQVRPQELSTGILGTLSQRARDFAGRQLQLSQEAKAGQPYRIGKSAGIPRPKPAMELKPGETTPLTQHIPVLRAAATYARHRTVARVVSGEKMVRIQEERSIVAPKQKIVDRYAKHPEVLMAAHDFGPPKTKEAMIATLEGEKARLIAQDAGKTADQARANIPELASLDKAIADVKAGKVNLDKLAKDVRALDELQMAAEQRSGLVKPDTAEVRKLMPATEMMLNRPDSPIISMTEMLGRPAYARARQMFEDARSRRTAARLEEKKAKSHLQASRRQQIRSQIPEAKAEGVAATRSAAANRQILKRDPEYVDAAKGLNKAARDLTTARKKYRNSLGSTARESTTAARERLTHAQDAVKSARQHMNEVKRSVNKRAAKQVSEAGRRLPPKPRSLSREDYGNLTKQKQREYRQAWARYRQATGLRKLHRAPVAPLRTLERHGGRVVERTQELTAAEKRVADATDARQAAERAHRAAADALKARDPRRRNNMQRNPADDLREYIRAVGPDYIRGQLEHIGHGEPAYFPHRLPTNLQTRGMGGVGSSVTSLKATHLDLYREGIRNMDARLLYQETGRLLNTGMRGRALQSVERGIGIPFAEIRKGKALNGDDLPYKNLPEDKLTAVQKREIVVATGREPSHYEFVNTGLWRDRMGEQAANGSWTKTTALDDMYRAAINESSTNVNSVHDNMPNFDRQPTALVPVDEMQVAKDLLDMGPKAQKDFIWNRLKTVATRWVLFNPGWFAFQMYAATFLAGIGHPTALRGIPQSFGLNVGAKKWVDSMPQHIQDNFEAVMGLPMTGSSDLTYRAGSLGAGISAINRMKATPTWERHFAGKNPMDTFFRGIPYFERGIRRQMLHDQVKKEAWQRMGGNMRRIGAIFDEIGKRTGEKNPTMAKLDQTMQEIAADRPTMERLAKNVTQWMGDYETFSNGERRFLQSNVMFYGFIRHSLMLAAYTLPVKHPGRLAIFAAMSKMVDTEQKQVYAKATQSYLATFIHEQYGVSMEKAMAGAKKLIGPGKAIDTNTIPASLMGRVMFPNGQIIDTVRASPLGNSILQAENPTQLLSVLNPGLSIPLQEIVGQNFFTGSPLQRGAASSDVGPIAPTDPNFYKVGLALAANYISPARLFSQAMSKYPTSERTASSFPLGPFSGLPGLSAFKETPVQYSQKVKTTTTGKAIYAPNNAEYMKQLMKRSEQVATRGGWQTFQQVMEPWAPHPSALISGTVLGAFDPTHGSIHIQAADKRAIESAKASKKSAKGGGLGGAFGPLGGSKLGGAFGPLGSGSSTTKGPTQTEAGGPGYFNEIRKDLASVLGKDFFTGSKGALASGQQNTFTSLLEAATGSKGGFSQKQLAPDFQQPKQKQKLLAFNERPTAAKNPYDAARHNRVVVLGSNNKPSAKLTAQLQHGGKKPKKGSPYVYPFSKGIQIGRTDMGIDPYGTGTIRAIGKARVIGTPAEGAGAGWPQEQGVGGEGVVYKLLDGPMKGKNIYTYEGPAADTTLQRGDILKKGQPFAQSTADFETGLAHGAAGGFAPVAHDVYTEGMVTKAGTKFGKFVGSLQGKGQTFTGGGGATTHKIPKITGPLTKDQRVFAGALAKQSGLDPRVTAAWTLAEGGSGDGSQNWLNIGVTDSGRLGVSTAGGFSNPVSAAKLTAKFIKGQWGGASTGIQAIQSTAGKSPKAQLSAIAGSGWATNPNYASLLSSTLGQVGAKGMTTVRVPATSGAISGTGTATTSGTTPTSPGVSPAVATNMQLSIGRSKAMTAQQKLRLIDTLTQPGGVSKMLGLGAFTPKGSLTTDGAKILASLSADRLRLLSTPTTAA